MDQAQLELQLKVWKELAISKQVMMRSAAEALKLDPDCTQEELRVALEAVPGQISKANADAARAQEEAKTAIAAMEKKLTASVQAQTTAETAHAELLTKHENLVKQIAIERNAVGKDFQKLKAQLVEKEKALKAINTALADTPENVIKKMNSLKKQKQEEADSRRQVETALNTLRKEKGEQDQQLTDATQNSTKLVTQYRELHALYVTLHEQLKPLLADAKDLPALAELDSKLLEDIEKGPSRENDKASSKDKSSAGEKARSRDRFSKEKAA